MNGTLRGLRRTAAALVVGVALGGGAAQAADLAKVNFTMDWAWQGPGAYALVAWKKGFFAEEGVDVTLSRGFGSGRVPVDIAAGTYDMGVGDTNPVIKFLAENPDAGLITVATLYESSPLVAVVKADGPIKSPKDLEGKTLAAPDFDAGRQLFPVFAGATGVDASTIEWLSVKPELREPMLARGEADGITGFITSSKLSLKALGLGESDLTFFRYKDYGADLYSGSVTTTKAFAEANPDAVKGVVAGMIKGLIYTIQNPDEAIAILKEHEPLTDEAIERERLKVAIEEMYYTDAVKQAGISSVDMARLQRSIEAVEAAYGLPNTLKAADLYTEAYLPPAAARMVPLTN